MTRFQTPYNGSTHPHRAAPEPNPQEGDARGPAGTHGCGAHHAPTPVSAGGPDGARKWNSWWSRRSPNLVTNDNPPVAMGLDMGSKTIKFVTLDAQGSIVHAAYHRHRSDVRTTLAELVRDMAWRYGDLRAPLAVTGSAGIGLSDELDLPFVQEVVATTEAVRRRYPEADCIVELGGEDAKITYLNDPVEQRMNATCAGGTGDFIDGIASMLGIRTREISRVALGSTRTYDIASRCAVFAQTDVRPLINAGVPKADIAESALEAVVRQTLGGLACGRPIRGTVVFLGGPLEHIPALVMAFRRKLGLKKGQGIKPPDAHLFAAMGAVEAAANAPTVSLSELARRLEGDTPLNAAPAGKLLARHGGACCDGDKEGCAPGAEGLLPPLFADDAERADFARRHAFGHIAERRLENAEGPLYLGFDAGSTSMKYVLVDNTGAIVAYDYRTTEGDTLLLARSMMEDLLCSLEGNAYSQGRRIGRAVVTGYGEDLLRAALGFDAGVVETVAHLRAAQHVCPDASFVLDIGGQDMKALWIRDGMVTDAVLNEACSSGCGAFVRSSTKALLLTDDEFSRRALAARNPVDLGAKCTVFMTSRVRHAQKSGADVGDIAAGVAYSIANNVMTRIIGKGHALPLGDRVVVQGGTFKSDAVLRAFEKVMGVQAVRPDMAHLMGAYGCALVACDGAAAGQESAITSLSEVRKMDVRKDARHCTGCGNACTVSVVDFGNGRRFVSGNRCERAYPTLFGQDAVPPGAARATPPNAIAAEQRLLAAFGTMQSTGRRGHVVVGIMNTLNLYESTPFWHTLLVQLGFSVVVPGRADDAALRDTALETVPSESACYPAKLSHLRYAQLARSGATVVLMPRFERGRRCPVACGYALALADNVDGPPIAQTVVNAVRPRSIVACDHDLDALLREFDSWLPPESALRRRELEQAAERAVQAQERFERAVRDASAAALAWTHGHPDRRAAVVAGRPYHVDADLLHGIDRELVRAGFAVVPQLGADQLQPGKSPTPSQWKPAKRLCNLVDQFAGDSQVEIVALRSFGCLYDAVSCDEAQDRAHAAHRPFTELKVDDIADTAHVRIRLRTLAHTSAHSARVMQPKVGKPSPQPHVGACQPCTDQQAAPAAPAAPATAAVAGAVTPDLCSTAKALVNLAASRAQANPGARELALPEVCVRCLTDATGFQLDHGRIPHPPLALGAFPQAAGKTEASGHPHAERPAVGLLGNPLLVFNSQLNDNVAELVESLGWRIAYPDPALLETDDVRYLPQLEAFRAAGVQRVIYLQSFGCLKGHVQSRGALHQLARLFPELPITVIDYDAESSALNRENRIRLALS